MSKKVPVVFSANDNYFSYLYVAVYSLIKHADRKKDYDIRILTTRMSQHNKKIISSLGGENVDITVMDLNSYIKGDDLRDYDFLSIETFYRLYIPLVLPMYDKVLYLDCDTVVCADVAPLLSVDIGDRCLAAVSDVDCSYLLDHCDEMGVDIKNTFNAGIIVINNKRFEKENIRKKCLDLLLEDYKREKRIYIYQDQDLLNYVLQDSWFKLDDEWNFQWQYLWRLDGVNKSYLPRYIKSSENAKIVHYAGDKKPLYYPNYPMAEKFWSVLKETGIYETVIFEAISQCTKKSKQLDCFKGWRFPYEKIPYGSSIALYAAGEVGTAFYEQMALSRYVKVSLWVDKNFSSIKSDYKIESPVELQNKSCEYQWVVIAVCDRLIAESIKRDLISMGINGEKIIWQNFSTNV